MPNLSVHAVHALSEQAAAWTHRAYVPYSQKSVAALIVLDDGAWVPGVRVESASYSLVIPALLNAYTTLKTVGRGEIAAICLSRPFLPEEMVFAKSIGDDLEQIEDTILLSGRSDLPVLQEDPLSPFLPLDLPATPAEGIAQARQLAQRAFVPESNFPVAAILESKDGRLIPGVNVENTDWSRILCAERNALGTAQTYGIDELSNLYLTCLGDEACSPCGACRQLLTELTPTIKLWMDRGSHPEQFSTPDSLLPDSFTGQALFNKLT